MKKGQVKFFRDKLGWGFIEREGEKDVFVHYKDIEGNGYKSLNKGDEVRFEIVQGPRGEKAINVQKVEK